MVKDETVAEAKRFFNEGQSIAQIARTLRHDRKTIKKWLAAEEPPKYVRRKPRPSKLEPFRRYLEDRIQMKIFNAAKLFAEVQAMGFSGDPRLVRRFVQSFRPLKPKRIEILEQATAQKVEGSPFPFRNQLERHLMKSIIQSLPSEVFKSNYVEPRVGIPVGEFHQMLIMAFPEFAKVTVEQLADYIRKGCPSFKESAPDVFFSKVLFPAILAQ